MDFIDLKFQYRLLEADISERMQKVLDHGQFILGPEVSELEKALATFTGAPHCITCANGTDALQLVLMAQGIGAGDVVFTTPFTFIATSEVIALLGATPIFVDIDPSTFNMDPAKLEKAIEKFLAENAEKPINEKLQAKVILPVDIFGLPADYRAIQAIGKKFGLFVLEDAAQSLGAEYFGQKVGGLNLGSLGSLGSLDDQGNLGVTATTSFFPAKPLGCYGDGGAIFTFDLAMAEKIRSIALHGKGQDRYENIQIGINSRLDTLQAAVLLSKLEIFPNELAARRRIADRYTRELHKHLSEKDIVTPMLPEGSLSAWAQYSVLSPKKNAIMAALKKAAIPIMVYYPKPLHLQKAFAYLNYRQGDFPISEKISEEIFSLPMHPYLSEPDQDQIIAVIVEACGKK